MTKFYWVMKDTEGNEVEPLGYYSQNEIHMMVWKHTQSYDREYEVVEQIASYPNAVIVKKI